MDDARKIAEELTPPERKRVKSGEVQSRRYSPVVSRLANRGLVTFVRNKGRVLTPLGREVQAILKDSSHVR